MKVVYVDRFSIQIKSCCCSSCIVSTYQSSFDSMIRHRLPEGNRWSFEFTSGMGFGIVGCFVGVVGQLVVGCCAMIHPSNFSLPGVPLQSLLRRPYRSWLCFQYRSRVLLTVVELVGEGLGCVFADFAWVLKQFVCFLVVVIWNLLLILLLPFEFFLRN